MPYVPYFEYCPETAEKETRCISLLLGNNEYGLPTGNYYFTENFCDECDCRRVFFNVFDEKKMVAVIYWGWESLDFYRKWYGFNDRELIRQLPGPALNEMSVQTRLAPGALKCLKTYYCPTKHLPIA